LNPVFVLGWMLLAVASFLRPRWALLVLLGFAIFFSEERWQVVMLGGSSSPVPTTIYSFHVSALTLQFALAGGLLLRALLRLRGIGGVRSRFLTAAFLVFLASIVWGEVLGRLTEGSVQHLFGEWSTIAIPLLVGLASLSLLSEKDVVVGLKIVLALAAARVAFGLVRYGLGRGDWNYEFHRRIAFWDTADGFLSAVVALTGLAVLLGWGRRSRAERVAGALMAAAGIAAIVVSLRRESFAMLAVSAIVLVALVWRPRKRVLIASLAAVLIALALGAAFVQTSNSLLAARIKSMDPLAHTSASGTNAFHLEDVRNAVLQVAERPITGWGFHTSPAPKIDYMLFSAPGAGIVVVHNTYLDVWLRTGVVGFVSLCALLVSGFWGGLFARRRYYLAAGILMAMLAGFVVESGVTSLLHSDRLPYFMVMAVVALAVMGAPDGAATMSPSQSGGESGVTDRRAPATRWPTWLAGHGALFALVCGIAVVGIWILAGVVGGGAQNFGRPLILSAAQLSIHTTGTASADGGWNLKAPGCVGEYLYCPSDGAYRISVLADVTQAAGFRPMLLSLVDNRAQGPERPVWRQWNAYSWTLHLAAGVHKIAFRFVIDNPRAGKQRQLLLVAQLLARATNGRLTPRVAASGSPLALSGSAGR
jgi:hypothetical protein